MLVLLLLLSMQPAQITRPNVQRFSKVIAYAEGVTGSFLGWVTHLVHEHRARLIGVARFEGLGADDALDCVQEAFQSFLVLPQARALVEISDDSAKILTVLTRNVARNRRRKHDRSKPHVSDDASIEALQEDERGADELVAA